MLMIHVDVWTEACLHYKIKYADYWSFHKTYINSAVTWNLFIVFTDFISS